MLATQSSKANAERLRLRELAKYFRLATAYNAEGEGDESGYDAQSQLAEDATLTALCQLASLKLGCQRSLISLVDNEKQHILAEATPSISLFDPNTHNVDDELVLGVSTLALADGVCPSTIGVFTGQCEIDFTQPGNIANKRYVMIQDLLSEGVTKDAPVLTQLPPILRYYLEVPLISSSGYVLGTICVIDSQQRPTSIEDVVKLEEIGRLVVSHIGYWRIKEDQQRAHKLLESLSHFIRGQDSISQWSEAQPLQTPALEAVTRRRSVHFTSSDAMSKEMPINPDSPTPARLDEQSRYFSDSDVTPIQINLAVTHDKGVNGYFGAPPMEDKTSTTSSGATCIRQAFARASNLLRQGLDLDATCFLEVPHNERFNSRRAQHVRSKTNKLEKGVRISSESDRSEEDSSTSNTQNGSSQRFPGNQVQCLRLGFSTEAKSSLAESSLARSHLSMSADLMSTLSARYPAGRIFHFDSQGYLSSGDDSQENSLPPTGESGRGKHLAEELRSLFPNAKSLIFCPLYDNDRQQIYAAFIGFTTNPIRALQASELVYVSAFTNSVMCEVMRLDGVAVDKAKSDFIASISHELRSPLHGVLASAQLLSEGKMYPAQKEFVLMIDNCGRGLLEVMDHLLDHAKINSYIQRSVDKKNPGSAMTSKAVETYSRVTEMDVFAVVEDTALTMCTQSYRILQHQRQSSTDQSSSARTGLKEPVQVPVILCLHPSASRIFDTEIGSWRRIMMNLVGNALKYTQTGYVSVDLSITEHTRKPGSHVAKLTVFDTGQGISESYLKHRLYTPFAQENNLTVGTGLGLSMVRQIVTSLHGSIDVQSEVGVGTVFELSIPLTVTETLNSQQADAHFRDEIQTTKKLVRGIPFNFVGFPSVQPVEDPHGKALCALKTSISQMLIEWFEMTESEHKTGSICIVEESEFSNNLTAHDQAGMVYLVASITGKRFEGTLKHARYVTAVPPLGPTRMIGLLQRLWENHSPAQQNTNVITAPTQTPEDVSFHKSQEPGKQPAAPTPPGPLLHQFLSTSSTMQRSDSRSSISSTERQPIEPKPKISILLVDDNDINLRLLIACIKRLKRSEIKYETARTGKEALNQYTLMHKAGFKVDLVFMDLSMPVMDGFQATKEIRTYEKRQGLVQQSRVVALTGLASSEAQEKVKRCGFNEYIRKPVDLNVVRTMIREMLDRE